MSTFYGRNYRKVELADISSISLLSATLSNSINNENGAVLTFDHQGVNCGTTAFTIFIKDIIPWTYITYKIYLVGTASCWAFSHGTNYAAADANIKTWDSNLDRVFFAQNCWELPQFTLKMFACDNNSDNFMHGGYAVGAYRSFMTTRRRNSMASLAGIAHGRACVSPTGQSIVSDIKVF